MTGQAEWRRPSSHEELQSILAEPRALVFLAVDWSFGARNGHKVLKHAVEQMASECTTPLPTVWIVDDQVDGFSDWADALRLGPRAVSGSGVVVWLRDGRPVWSVPSAAATGAAKIAAITAAHFGC